MLNNDWTPEPWKPNSHFLAVAIGDAIGDALMVNGGVYMQRVESFLNNIMCELDAMKKESNEYKAFFFLMAHLESSETDMDKVNIVEEAKQFIPGLCDFEPVLITNSDDSNAVGMSILSHLLSAHFLSSS